MNTLNYKQMRMAPRTDLRRKLRLFSKFAVYHGLKKRFVWRKRLVRSFYAAGVAMVLLCGMVLQTYLQINPPKYNLDEQTRKLVGESRDDAQEYLKENKEQTAFEFAVPKESEPENKEHFGRNADTYSATLSKNAKEGITYTDTQTNIGITLVPKFKTLPAQKSDGDHVVYPFGAQKLVYTLKYNGLKEDIVVPKYTTDELNYEFELSLPSGVEARLDAQGNIGIYSSDPTLFGDISFGSDEDRAKIDKAREKGEKNHLVVTIPSPIVKDARGNEYNDKSQFILSEVNRQQRTDNGQQDLPAEVREQLKTKTTKNVYTLTIASRDLKDLPYPISIDPTIQTSLADDFKNGNLEGGIDLDTSGALIKRSPLTGGTTGAWGDIGVFNTASNELHMHGSVASNGYVYNIGGKNDGTGGACVGICSQVRYAALNTDGSLGSWTSTSSLGTARALHAVAAYNGYLYAIGGSTNLGLTVYTADVEYAKINPLDGSLGSWSSPAGLDLLAQRWLHNAVVSNGYLYVSGGHDGTNPINTTYYAKLNGDGTIPSSGSGSWATATATFNTGARFALGMTAYNGYLYILGGYNAVNFDDAQYAKPGSDGNFSNWTNTSSLGTARHAFNAIAHKGYMYAIGGQGGGVLGTVEYAQINADGSLGTWRTTNSLVGPRRYFGVATNNNYLYVIGGCFIADNSCDTNEYRNVERTTIDSAGVLRNATWSTASNSFTTSRFAAGTVVSNGYIYVIGGCTIDGQTLGTCNNLGSNGATANVQFAAIQSSGNIGAWASTTAALPAARWNMVAVANNGVIYAVGGCEAAVVTSDCTVQTSTYYATPATGTGQISSWSTNSTNTLGTGVREAAGTVYNGYIYITGGRNSSGTAQNIVQYAPISNTGITGNFANTTNSFTTARYLLSAFTYNGRLYVGNGTTGAANLADLQRATLDSNGNITTSWTTQSNYFTTSHSSFMFADKGYLYYMQGESTSVSYALLSSSDGSAGTLTTTQAKPVNYLYATTGGFTYNGYIYGVGGCTSSGGSDTCSTKTTASYYQTINNGGSGAAGSVTTGSNTMTTARTRHATAVSNGYLYAISGCTAEDGTNCTAYTDTVEKAALNSDGSIGSWSAVTSLPVIARYDHVAVAHNGYIYVIAGKDSGGTALSSVLYTQVNSSNGTLQAPSGCGLDIWCPTTSLPATRDRHAATVYNGYIYVVGGSSATATYYIAPNSDGSLPSSNCSGFTNPWCTGTAIASATTHNALVAYNGYLYNLVTVTSEVFSISLNADGSMGASWTEVSNMDRLNGTSFAVAAHGFIYTVGGVNIADTKNIQFAPILADGKLGLWQQSVNKLNQRREHVRGAYYNGKIYAVGGQDGATIHSSTDYFAVQSVPRTGSYSRLIDFGSGVKPTKLITRGTKRSGTAVKVDYETVNNTAANFTNSQSITDMGYGGTNGQNFSLGTNVTLSRYLLIRYTIDESLSAVFADDTNQTTITDFDIYFDPNPGARLKGGRTFVNGTDRGLDASP